MEFEFFGERCTVQHCRQHDYLPFKCPDCSAPFCLEHRLPAAHECQRAPAAALEPLPCAECGAVIARLPRGASEATKDAAYRAHSSRCTHARARVPLCPVVNCAQRLAAPVTCRACRVQHCITHRLPENHACAARAAPVTDSLKMSARRARRGAAPVPAGFENSPLHPVGDKKVEGSERLYVEVHFGGELSGKKAVYFFFSRKWRIGRTIDAIAKHAGVPTVVSGRRLQMRIGGVFGTICGMLDGIGETVRQHSVVYVEYGPLASAGALTCASELSQKTVAKKQTIAAK